QMQVLYASFEKLTFTLAAHVESTTKPGPYVGNSDIFHTTDQTRDQNNLATQILQRPRDVNYISILEEEERPTRSDEAVVMPADRPNSILHKEQEAALKKQKPKLMRDRSPPN
ncbi:6849_t:CDS:2, partial [Scutellospora calospora]